MTVDDATTPYRIGSSWKTAATPKDYTIGLGFEVEKGPASASGSISQTPTDKLKGSYVGPFSSYKRQGVWSCG